MSFGDRFLQTVMGNAVRIQNEIQKVVHPELNPNNRCTACRIAFNVLHNRRRQCSDCREPFCSACLIRMPAAAPRDSDRRLCNRCRIFSSNFSWDELMQLKVRDLRWFLERQRIRTDGYKEKEQLADLIMTLFGSDRYYQDQARRQQRVAMMTSNMQEEFAAARASRRMPENNDSFGHSEEAQTEPHGEPAPTATEPPASSPTGDDRPTPTSEPARAPPPYPGSTNTQPQQTGSAPSTSDTSASESDTSTPVRSRTERVHLIDFKSCEEVEALSIRQLKILLTSNHVDYRGCCEKVELVTKAKRLVTSHLENVKKLAALNAAEEGNTDAAGEDDLEDDMCKICMDALIDCVLLECGHMVTCLECGKRMAECPICRQYVVRAVRIFKA